jgi:hypothetical protein
MKPREYVTKYRLRNTIRFSHSEFCEDLAADFRALLETHEKNFGPKTRPDSAKRVFFNSVREIQGKFDAIFSQTSFSEKMTRPLWGWFYASVICPARDERFPDLVRKKGGSDV